MNSFNESNVVLVAEKLETATKNVEQVFNSGKKEGYDQGYSEGFISGLEGGRNYDAYISGREDEFNFTWDTIQNNGKRTNYTYAFANWTGKYFTPKYKIAPTDEGGAKNIFYFFRAAKKLESRYIDLSKVPRGTNDAKSLSYSFCSCGNLEEIGNIGLSPSYSYAYAFAYNTVLKKIEKITVDSGTIMTNAFKSCYALEEVYFGGEIGTNISFSDSKHLKWESITNVVEHLSDSSSGRTLTFAQQAIDESGIDSDTWNELTLTKPNWTITLV